MDMVPVSLLDGAIATVSSDQDRRPRPIASKVLRPQPAAQDTVCFVCLKQQNADGDQRSRLLCGSLRAQTSVVSAGPHSIIPTLMDTNTAMTNHATAARRGDSVEFAAATPNSNATMGSPPHPHRVAT